MCCTNSFVPSSGSTTRAREPVMRVGGLLREPAVVGEGLAHSAPDAGVGLEVGLRHGVVLALLAVRDARLVVATDDGARVACCPLRDAPFPREGGRGGRHRRGLKPPSGP